MKKSILLVMVKIMVACSNDNGQGLTEGIGSIPLELRDTTNFSYFLPGTGTFEFQQNSVRSTQVNTIETKVRIKNKESDSEPVSFELFLFKNANFSGANLDFAAEASIPKQEEGYVLLFSNGTIKMANHNFHLARFSEEETSTSGKYSGTVRVFSIDGAENGDGQDDSTDGNDDGSGEGGSEETDDETGDNPQDGEEENGEENTDESLDEDEEGQEEQTASETTLDIFNVIGNIDVDNNLFLLSTKEGAEFNTLSGVLLTTSNPEFAGNFDKDSSKSLTGTFQTSAEEVVIQLSVDENGESKNLTIELNKNN